MIIYPNDLLSAVLIQCYFVLLLNEIFIIVKEGTIIKMIKKGLCLLLAFIISFSSILPTNANTLYTQNTIESTTQENITEPEITDEQTDDSSNELSDNQNKEDSLIDQEDSSEKNNVVKGILNSNLYKSVEPKNTYHIEANGQFDVRTGNGPGSFYFYGYTNNVDYPGNVNINVHFTKKSGDLSTQFANITTNNGSYTSNNAKVRYELAVPTSSIKDFISNPVAEVSFGSLEKDDSTNTWTTPYMTFRMGNGRVPITISASGGNVTFEKGSWGTAYGGDYPAYSKIWVDENSANILPGDWGNYLGDSYPKWGYQTVDYSSRDRYMHCAVKTHAGKTASVVVKIPATPSYTVSYNMNGGSGEIASTTAFTHNSCKVSSKTPSRTGYTFKGWNTKNDGTGTWYYGGNTVAARTSNLVLYAQWTPNQYSITYKGNGGTWSNTDTWSTKVNYDSNYVTEKNFFSRPGYQFIGWNEKVDGSGTDWTDWINKPWKWSRTANVTLYAQWTPNQYSITYKGNGGTWSNTDTWTTKVNYDSNYVTEKNFFSRPGYTFIGWNEKADGSGTDWTDWIGKPWKWSRTANVTLYAQWFNYDPGDVDIVIPTDPPGINSNIPPFMDGDNLVIQLGDEFNPLDYVKADDPEDGDISDRIVVKKNPIVYEEDGKTTKKAGKYEVVYSVTDMIGATTETTITVIVNDPPKIEAEERWFFKDAEIDSAELLRKVKATDKEDGTITDKVKIKSIKYTDENIIENPDKLDTSTTGVFEIEYEVTDKYKKNSDSNSVNLCG